MSMQILCYPPLTVLIIQNTPLTTKLLNISIVITIPKNIKTKAIGKNDSIKLNVFWKYKNPLKKLFENSLTPIPEN